MTADPPDTEVSIEEQRERIRGRLRHNLDPLGRSVEAVGRVTQRMLRRDRPLPHVVNAATVVVVVLVILLSEALLRGRAWTERWELSLFDLALVGLLVMVLGIHRSCDVAIVRVARDHLLDLVESPSDLALLVQGLRYRRKSFGLIVLLSVVLGVLQEWWTLGFVLLPRDPSTPPSLSRLLVFVFFALAIAAIVEYLFVAQRLGGFRLQLYSPDPSKAEVIVRMSSLLRQVLLLIGVYAVCEVLVYALLDLATPFALSTMVFMLWIPLIGVFVLGQGSLSKIIVRAKWHKLRDIQERVDRLDRKGDLENEATMETIRRLTDHHDRIFRTPNSAFNLRTGLNFVHSLLLPVIALLLANLDQLLELIR